MIEGSLVMSWQSQRVQSNVSATLNTAHWCVGTRARRRSQVGGGMTEGNPLLCHGVANGPVDSDLQSLSTFVLGTSPGASALPRAVVT